jgi:replicative DNA helicase
MRRRPACWRTPHRLRFSLPAATIDFSPATLSDGSTTVATIDRKARTNTPQPLGEVLDRQPPCSIEAERAVLGSLLLLPEVCDEVALILRPDDFYDDANARIYRHIVELHDSGKPVEVQLLLQRLKDSGDYDAIGGASYLLEISQQVATAAHAEHYAHIVRDKAVLRSLIHVGTDIVHEASDPSVDAREMLSRAEAKVFRILDKKGETNVESVSDIITQTLERIDARLQGKHAVRGLETGFIDYDEISGGFHDSELVILAARPSMGKTALALNMVEHIAIDCERPVLIVSLEMASLELADRLICSRARIDSHRLRTGTISKDEMHKLVSTATDISRAPLFIDDSPSRNLTEIAANARRLKRRENLSLLVIDYLQLIEPDNSRDPRQEQVARIARRLKGLARELSIPVVCLAQLNRHAESSGGQKPQLSHLRESGAIEQDADVVMFVHREEMVLNSDDERALVKGQADLLVKKQRNGRTGDLKLTWLGQFTRFENCQHVQYDEFREFDAGVY